MRILEAALIDLNTDIITKILESDIKLEPNILDSIYEALKISPANFIKIYTKGRRLRVDDFNESLLNKIVKNPINEIFNLFISKGDDKFIKKVLERNINNNRTVISIVRKYPTAVFDSPQLTKILSLLDKTAAYTFIKNLNNTIPDNNIPIVKDFVKKWFAEFDIAKIASIININNSQIIMDASISYANNDKIKSQLARHFNKLPSELQHTILQNSELWYAIVDNTIITPEHALTILDLVESEEEIKFIEDYYNSLSEKTVIDYFKNNPKPWLANILLNNLESIIDPNIADLILKTNSKTLKYNVNGLYYVLKSVSKKGLEYFLRIAKPEHYEILLRAYPNLDHIPNLISYFKAIDDYAIDDILNHRFDIPAQICQYLKKRGIDEYYLAAQHNIDNSTFRGYIKELKEDGDPIPAKFYTHPQLTSSDIDYIIEYFHDDDHRYNPDNLKVILQHKNKPSSTAVNKIYKMLLDLSKDDEWTDYITREDILIILKNLTPLLSKDKIETLYTEFGIVFPKLARRTGAKFISNNLYLLNVLLQKMDKTIFTTNDIKDDSLYTTPEVKAFASWLPLRKKSMLNERNLKGHQFTLEDIRIFDKQYSNIKAVDTPTLEIYNFIMRYSKVEKTKWISLQRVALKHTNHVMLLGIPRNKWDEFCKLTDIDSKVKQRMEIRIDDHDVGHPNSLKYYTLGWVRFYDYNKTVFIEEVQTDIESPANLENAIIKALFSKIIQVAHKFYGAEKIYIPDSHTKTKFYNIGNLPKPIYDKWPTKLRFKRAELKQFNKMSSKIPKNATGWVLEASTAPNTISINYAQTTANMVMRILRTYGFLSQYHNNITYPVMRVVGKLRRNVENVDSIDLMVIGNLSILRNIDVFQIVRIMDEEANIIYNGMQINLYTYKPEYAGSMELFLTGPPMYVASVVRIAQKQGYELIKYGLYKNGKLLKCSESEATLLNKLGVAYIQPESRK